MKYKTAFYSFYLPVALAMYMVRLEGVELILHGHWFLRLALKTPKFMLLPNPFYWRWESSFKYK